MNILESIIRSSLRIPATKHDMQTKIVYLILLRLYIICHKNKINQPLFSPSMNINKANGISFFF